MLDRNLVAKNAELVRENLVKRNANAEILSELNKLVVLINMRRELQTKTDSLRAQRKVSSKEIGQLYKEGKREEAEEKKASVAKIGHRLNILESERKELLEQEEVLLLAFPIF